MYIEFVFTKYFITYSFISKNLRWHGTPPCYDELFIEINNIIKCNSMNSFLSFIDIIQLVRGFITNM